MRTKLLEAEDSDLEETQLCARVSLSRFSHVLSKFAEVASLLEL